MRRAIALLFVSVSLAVPLAAQQQNTVAATSTWGGINGPPWPIIVNWSSPAPITFQVAGMPNQGYMLVNAPAGISVGSVPTSVGSVDLDLGLGYQVIMDGINFSTGTFLDALATTGAGGLSSWPVPISQNIYLGGMQVLVCNPTAPSLFSLTAASDVNRVIAPVTSGTTFVAVGHDAGPFNGLASFSTDGGVTWNAATTQPLGAVLLNGVAASGGNFVAVGSDYWGTAGEVYISMDAGVTWNAATTHPPGSSDLSSVATDGTTFVAVGYGNNAGQAFFSTNNGDIWAAGTTLPQQLNELRGVASDGTNFVAVGGNLSTNVGHAAFSTDGGDSWIVPTIPPQSGTVLRGVTTDGTNFIAVSSPGVFISTDGGDTWAPAMNLPQQLNQLRGVATDGTNFVAVGGNLSTNVGHAFLSTDGGNTWTGAMTQPYVVGATFLHSVTASGTNFVAVDQAGQAFVSTDAGANWSAATTQPPGVSALYGVVAN